MSAQNKAGYAITPWCDEAGFSPALYFKRKKKGLGPREVQVNRRKIIIESPRDYLSRLRAKQLPRLVFRRQCDPCPKNAKPRRAGLAESSFPGGNIRESAPNSAPDQAEILRNPRAVREAKRLLKLEFLHECAGGIAVHAGLVQTFVEIGDPSGACYALRQLSRM
jgi:hypothetical protein